MNSEVSNETEKTAAAPSRPRAKKHDALCSFPERIAQLEQRNAISDRTRANLVRALESIDHEKRETFLDKHRNALGDIETLAPVKYADFGYWALRNVQIAEWLGLDQSPPLDILDIAAGSGNFGMVAQSMGHHVVCTDLANDWYDELCKLTRVERVVAPVERGARYLPVQRRFDLITTMLPAFHKKTVAGTRFHWSVEDWRQFLLGITNDLLRPGGRIFILMPLDKDDEGKLHYSPLVRWAYERGARLDRSSPSGPVRHILFDPATPETFSEEGPNGAERPPIELEWQN
jgi:SAM-dependent methyltransferase